MHTNFGHGICTNKSKSIALAIQVDEFLKMQGKTTAEQVPFGYSEMAKKRDIEGYDAQSTMRQIMFNSVQESKKNTFTSDTKVMSAEQLRREKNKTARADAIAEGKKEFTGQCLNHGIQIFKIKCGGADHICVVCRDKHSVKQTMKRRKKQVDA